MTKVLIWGTGRLAERCAESLKDDIEIIAYVQSKLDEIALFKGKKILSGGTISNIDYDYIILANHFEKEIVEAFHLAPQKLVYYREIMRGDLQSLFRVPDEVFVSFGENCLTDNLLERHGLKTFATPYSHGRFNIEYINAIEHDGYANLLKRDCLKYFDYHGKRVVRNIYYMKQNNIYDDSVMNGFEFTHHDVLNNVECRETFLRRIKRLQEIKDKNLYIFYHHRFCERTDEKKLLGELNILHKRYSLYNKNVFVIMFTQKIVTDETERKVVYELRNGINVFLFYTLKVWEGTNGDIFWARIDDDLISKMMHFIREKKLGTFTESYIL